MRAVYHCHIHFVGNQPFLFVLTKRCNTCLKDKPFSDFAYDNAQNDGHAGRCRQCKSERYQVSEELKEHRKAYNKAYREANHEKLKAYDHTRHTSDEYRAKRRERDHAKPPVRRTKKPLKQRVILPPSPITHKACPACDPPTLKPVSEFSKSKTRKDGLSVYCRACTSKKSHARLHKRRVYARLRNLDPTRRQKQREMLNAWRRAHPMSQRELTLRRIARKKAASIGKVSLKRILERDGMWCYICEHPILSHEHIDFDHVVPLSRNGPHSEDNIKISHRGCNRRKGTKLLEELTLLERRGFYAMGD